MKNLFKLFAVIFLFVFSLPAFAAEKISNFEVRFTLNKDASATVKEYITFNAEHDKIKRGLYRQLSYDMGANISIDSLTLDYQKCPYTTESTNNFLRINFGTDDLLPVGEHTYILTYTLTNVMSTNLFRDFLLWPVTGSSWALPIEKAKIILTVPFAVKPLPKKIISYTAGVKENKFDRTGENVFVFETAKPLKEGENFSIYFPVEKGVFQFKWYEIQYMPVFVCCLIILYYFIIWYLVGRDPKKRNLPYRSTPPKNVSAGFASYFLNGKFSPKNLATVFASLIVKNKIKITFPKWSKPEFEKLTNTFDGLEEDEIRLMMSLPYSFKFNKESYGYLEKAVASINYYYEEKIQDYVINNLYYMVFPIAAFLGILFYFESRGAIPGLLLILILNILVPIIVAIYIRRIKEMLKVMVYCILATGVSISAFLSPKFLLDPNVIAVVITVFLTALFIHLINNLMYEGALLRDELAAFKKYMTVAERGRVALSNPSNATKIFCDYLPYAYAFGMESKWFKKFKNKIDFRMKNDYESLTSSSVINIGLVVTLCGILNKHEGGFGVVGGGGFGGGFGGKGGFGGGGGR